MGVRAGDFAVEWDIYRGHIGQGFTALLRDMLVPPVRNVLELMEKEKWKN